ncbi:MAG: DUF2993 domain-containing protein [Spirulinaceae cyanobacterium]
MIFGIGNIGEGAISKVAEIALSSQVDDSDKLKVDISINADSIAEGTLDAMTIQGKGLIIQKDLRMAEMKVSLGKLSVNPLKAVAGNLELSEPTQGKAHIVVTESDLNRAFNSDYLEAQMGDIQVETENKAAILEIENMTCHLLSDGKVNIQAQAKILPSGEMQDIEFSSVPRIRDDSRGVVLEDVHYQNNRKVSPELTNALLEKAKQILDLSTFEMPGISLTLENLEVRQKELILDGIAHVTQLPS